MVNTSVHAPTTLQVLDRAAAVPAVHVAVGDELSHRLQPADSRRSLRLVLLGV